MVLTHPIKHILQLVVVQIGECVLRKLDRRMGHEGNAKLQQEESVGGVAGHFPEGEEARGRVVINIYGVHG